MKINPFKVYRSLAPLAFLYGIGVRIRNKFFDWGVLPSEEFDIPVISVGNITVGGTGKTPHTEYLIGLLANRYRIAVLSRGYKRKTRGYRLASENSTAHEIGDEPLQIKKKFPNIIVAVDGNRRNGIRQLLATEPAIDIILLDDAYQHRYVKPGISILLTDYNRLIYEDYLLPMGRLREPAWERNRANMVIVTKCPEDIKPIDFRIIQKYLDLFTYQELYFTTFQYGLPIPVFPDLSGSAPDLDRLPENCRILLVTGIANPHSICSYIKEKTERVECIHFQDHHSFTKNNLIEIEEKFRSLGHPAYLLVTEKDAARLLHNKHVTAELKQHLFYLPIKVLFLQERHDSFNTKILHYVTTNKRNSQLHQK